MEISASTDIGLVRKNNEDSFDVGTFSETDTVWAIVCDGMGGALGGETASSVCVETAKLYLESRYTDDMPLNTLKNILECALLTANTAVFNRACADSSLAGMGTTAVAAVITNERAVIAHVGDSRAYLLRGDTIRAITKDHSLVQHYIDIGRITPEEARVHPERNMITRAIGVDRDVETDIDIEQLEPGDVILICTDGLNGCVEDSDILRVFTHASGDGVAELVQAALDAGGNDNVTVVAVRV